MFWWFMFTVPKKQTGNPNFNIPIRSCPYHKMILQVKYQASAMMISQVILQQNSFKTQLPLAFAKRAHNRFIQPLN